MSFVASASLLVKAPRAQCFARFIDFPAWRRFMPASFRALRGPSRALAVGDRLKLRIDAGGPFPLLTTVTVVRFESNRAIAWRGGIPGVLEGEHAFLFDDADGGATLARSEETWSGALTALSLVERAIKRAAERIGEEQLAGFARDIVRTAPA
jgi:hypothetical protein